jgi:hypothetical protein
MLLKLRLPTTGSWDSSLLSWCALFNLICCSLFAQLFALLCSTLICLSLLCFFVTDTVTNRTNRTIVADPPPCLHRSQCHRHLKPLELHFYQLYFLEQRRWSAFRCLDFSTSLRVRDSSIFLERFNEKDFHPYLACWNGIWRLLQHSTKNFSKPRVRTQKSRSPWIKDEEAS